LTLENTTLELNASVLVSDTSMETDPDRNDTNDGSVLFGNYYGIYLAAGIGSVIIILIISIFLYAIMNKRFNAKDMDLQRYPPPSVDEDEENMDRPEAGPPSISPGCDYSPQFPECSLDSSPYTEDYDESVSELSDQYIDDEEIDPEVDEILELIDYLDTEET
jgi:hypothetical protein